VLALALLIALAAVPAWAQFTGARACAPCHPAQARSQAASHHATALRPAAQTDLAQRLSARPLRERSGVEFAYAQSADGVAVTVTQDAARVDAVLEWAFGAGAQAITPVGRRDGKYFEHRLSWYREAGHAARTLGHPGTPSETPEKALGITQAPAAITQCFQCHATAVKPGPDLSAMQPGVTCERCHGPGAAHVKSASPSDVVRLSKLSARESVLFCAECHRATAPLDDPGSVRYQPVGLMASRCFRVSGTLSCVTCHDPHADASLDHKFYAPKCLACHATGGAPIRECRRASGGDCLACHMKKSSPFPFLTFTDHRIRVAR